MQSVGERRSPLGDAVRVGRLVRRKSHRDVSDATGISVWRLRAFERGESRVRPEELIRIWRYLTRDERAVASA
jgi:hypothetical protein